MFVDEWSAWNKIKMSMAWRVFFTEKYVPENEISVNKFCVDKSTFFVIANDIIDCLKKWWFDSYITLPYLVFQIHTQPIWK